MFVSERTRASRFDFYLSKSSNVKCIQMQNSAPAVFKVLREADMRIVARFRNNATKNKLSVIFDAFAQKSS